MSVTSNFFIFIVWYEITTLFPTAIQVVKHSTTAFKILVTLKSRAKLTIPVNPVYAGSDFLKHFSDRDSNYAVVSVLKINIDGSILYEVILEKLNSSTIVYSFHHTLPMVQQWPYRDWLVNVIHFAFRLFHMISYSSWTPKTWRHRRVWRVGTSPSR